MEVCLFCMGVVKVKVVKTGQKEQRGKTEQKKDEYNDRVKNKNKVFVTSYNVSLLAEEVKYLLLLSFLLPHCFAEALLGVECPYNYLKSKLKTQ